MGNGTYNICNCNNCSEIGEMIPSICPSKNNSNFPS